MRTIPEHLERVTRATGLYVEAYNEQRSCIVEAHRDGCTLDQLAEAARTRPEVIAAIVGEER